MTERNVAIFGATGSIGLATLDVIRSLGMPWKVAAISAHAQHSKLNEIAEEFHPKFVIFSGEVSGSQVHALSTAGPDSATLRHLKLRHWKYGAEALAETARAPEINIVVAAIVGSAGVSSTLAALEAGKRVALANKETLVCAGPIVAQLLHDLNNSAPPQSEPSSCTEDDYTAEGALAGPRLVPVDSEHSAIFQCLQGHACPPRKLILTASGGPFREATFNQMREATVDQALNHPTWKMGKKITIDSATMMNKALELIEARWLFGIPAERLEVVVHPQSIIHSLVEYVDGSVLSQMSPPDMRLPIQYALTYPDRVAGPALRWDRQHPLELTLKPVDLERFPAILLGFEVARVGGSAGAVLNAANEAAVDLFLKEQIRFTDIVRACRSVLDHHTFEARPTLDRLLQLDQWARAEVRRWSCLTT